LGFQQIFFPRSLHLLVSLLPWDWRYLQEAIVEIEMHVVPVVGEHAGVVPRFPVATRPRASPLDSSLPTQVVEAGIEIPA